MSAMRIFVALLLGCLCLPAYAQDSKPCKIATQRANVPQLPTAFTDYDVAPMEFLFSERGVDFYSATSYRRPYPMAWIRENGLTVVAIYQDESARQEKIGALRKQGSLTFAVGRPQHLENLKYAMINFFGPGASFVRDIEFFEPKPCVTPTEIKMAGRLWMQYADFEIWGMNGLHAYKDGPNWITGFYSPYLAYPASDNSVYVKIHNLMTKKVRDYIAQSGNSDE